jgi:hypothetical protein
MTHFSSWGQFSGTSASAARASLGGDQAAHVGPETSAAVYDLLGEPDRTAAPGKAHPVMLGTVAETLDWLRAKPQGSLFGLYISVSSALVA